MHKASPAVIKSRIIALESHSFDDHDSQASAADTRHHLFACCVCRWTWHDDRPSQQEHLLEVGKTTANCFASLVYFLSLSHKMFLMRGMYHDLDRLVADFLQVRVIDLTAHVDLRTRFFSTRFHTPTSCYVSELDS